MAAALSIIAGIAALVTLVTVPLYMTEGAWNFLTLLYRKGYTTLQPRQGNVRTAAVVGSP
jgi:hypothetical protein